MINTTLSILLFIIQEHRLWQRLFAGLRPLEWNELGCRITNGLAELKLGGTHGLDEPIWMGDALNTVALQLGGEYMEEIGYVVHWVDGRWGREAFKGLAGRN